MKLPTPRWDFGTMLYHRADPETGGIVTGYGIRPGGVISYGVTWEDHEESYHFEIELTEEKTYSTTDKDE